MKKFNENEVAASLEQGQLLYGIRKWIVILCFSVALLAPILTICIAVTIGMGYMDWDENVVIAVITVNAFCGVLLLLAVYIFIKDRLLKRKVRQWLEDAVVVDATLARLERHLANENPYRIAVGFDYQGRVHTYRSVQGDRVKGFSKFYMKYAREHGGRAEVLYSPTYRQVLLLK